MKKLFRSVLLVVGIMVFAYFQLPNLKRVSDAMSSPSFAHLADDHHEVPFDSRIVEAFQHFPASETEFYFGDFDQKDLFENHPLLDLSFPRKQNQNARCGFRKWLPTLKRNETILYSGVVHVVCRL